jgi:ATP-binding cassette subfamily B protein
MSIMGGLDAEAYDRTYRDSELIRRIAGYFKPHVRTVVLVAALMALMSISATITPLLVSWGIDTLSGSPGLQILLGVTALLTLLGVLYWCFNFVRLYIGVRAVGDVVFALRRDAFRAVMRRDLSFYDQYASGRIVSRVTSDTQDFATVVTLTIELLSQLVLVLVISGVMFFVNWRLALVTCSIVPIVAVVALVFRRLARHAMRQTQRAQASVNASIQETVSGIAVAKNFRQEAALYSDFQNTNHTAYRVQLLRVGVFGSIFPLLNTIEGVAIAVLVYVGGMLVIDNSVSLGDWYLFVQSIAIFFYPITSIASFWSQFQQGLAASERVFALIDADAKVVQTGNKQIGRLQGRITFDRVSFSYDEAADNAVEEGASKPKPAVLRDFSLEIPAGQALAVVGHTGAGKSSLIKLILRFYEFQEGRLLIDGHDIRELDLASYRRQLGLVPQVPFLFSGTIADNIRYGRPDATDEEVAAAARQLGDGSWVDDLPQGLQTDVGERGARLSLGQRQLVALARVLLQDPAVLLLDEATASIDPFTEAQVQAGLAAVLRGRTSVVIAHRLSTVRAADRIIVLQQGKIIEEGTHEQLLEQGNHYAELYTTYFRHQSLSYQPWEEPAPQQ